MNRLFVQRITSIGAVEEGDNPGAHIMLFKRRTTTPDVKVVKPVKSTDSASSKGTVMDLTKLRLSDEAIVVVEAEFEKLRSEIEKLTKPDPEDILKGLDDEVKAEFAKRAAEIAEMKKAAAETTEALAKERDARLTAEFVKTATKYETILGAADEAGPMLKALATDDDAFEWLTKKLDAVTAIVKASDVFKELGVASEDDPVTLIETLAKEKMKDNSKLTLAQAKVLTRKERPDLRDKEREAK